MPEEARESPLEQIINYLKLNYRRRYKNTYTLTRENIMRALEVVEFCFKNGLYQSVDACVADDLKERKRLGRPTYDYRRMENFIKELGLYQLMGYWMVVRWLIKLTPGYESGEELTQEEIEEIGDGEKRLEREKIDADVNVIAYAPPIDMTKYSIHELIKNDVRMVLQVLIGFNPGLSQTLIDDMMRDIEGRDYEISLFEPFTKEAIDYHHHSIVEDIVEVHVTALVRFYDLIVKIRGGKVVEKEEVVRREYEYKEAMGFGRPVYYPFKLIPKSVVKFYEEFMRGLGK